MRKILTILAVLANPAIALAQSSLFKVGATIPVAVGGQEAFASTLVVADFNRDGKIDIATANQTDGTITVLLGDGKGGLAQAPGSPIKAVDVQSIAAGDFNGDGIVDLLVSGVLRDSSPGLASLTTGTLLGDGTGAFSVGGSTPSSLFVSGHHTVTGDFNGDGKLDAVVLCCNGAWFLPGDGSGSFGYGQALFQTGAVATNIASADFNGDGKLDVVLVEPYSVDSVSIWFGDGTGHFPTFAASAEGQGLASSNPPLAVGGFDAAGTQILTCPYLFSWNGTYGYAPNNFGAIATPLSTCPAAIAVADFNGDGKLDWAGVASDGTVRVYLGDGTGEFILEAGSPYAAGNSGWGIATADLDGDGKPDLVVYTGTNIVTLLNTGDVAVRSQTIQFPALSNVTYSTPSLPVSATATSTLPVSFVSNTPLVCTVSGILVTFLSAGTCSITATQAGNALFYAAPPVTQTFTVNQAPQFISFDESLYATVGSPPIMLTATVNSGLPISYTAQPPSICTVSGSTLMIVGAGTCSVTASQAGNANYEAAAPVTLSVAVTSSQVSQTITFGSIPAQTVGTTLSLTPLASASSHLAVIFASNTTAACTVSGSGTTMIAAGTCAITASQPGNASYSAAAPVTQTFTVTLAPQNISWPALAAQQTVGGTVSLNATSSSGLPVAFTSNTPSVCTGSGTSVNLTAVGTCSITASQGGNSTYAPAPSITQTFAVVSPSLQTQTITFAPLTGRTLGSGVFTVSATASSGLPVTFISATPAVCTVSGNTVTLVSAGTCTITAGQGGNATYNAAAPVSQSFTVAPAALTAQTIRFASIANVALSAGTLTLSATASSGLAVTFTSVTPAVCAVSGNTTVALVTVGTCTITASQGGNATYNAATPVNQSFTVTASSTGPIITAVENAASYAAGTVSPGSYAVLFGSNLAAQAGDSSVAVSITDAAGNKAVAGIIYAGTTQVNSFIPASVALGSGTVTLSSSTGTATFPISIGNISPGLFTVDAAATIAAAQVITTAADGSQIVEPVANCTGSGCTFVPIPLTAGIPSYLILYGTGLRGAGNTSYFSVAIGGVPAAVQYAGPQGEFPGLDQVNVLIPAALAGKGQVTLQLAVFTTQANAVQLEFQ